MIIAGEHGGVNKVLRSTWLRSSIDECAFYARFMLVLCNPYAHTNCDTFFLRARGYLKKTLFVTLTKIYFNDAIIIREKFQSQASIDVQSPSCSTVYSKLFEEPPLLVFHEQTKCD